MNKSDMAWENLKDWIMSIDKFYNAGEIGYLSSSADLFWQCQFTNVHIDIICNFIERSLQQSTEHKRYISVSTATSCAYYDKQNITSISIKQLIYDKEFINCRVTYCLPYREINGLSFDITCVKIKGDLFNIQFVWSPVRLIWGRTELKELFMYLINYLINIQDEFINEKLIIYTDTKLVPQVVGKFAKVEIC